MISLDEFVSALGELGSDVKNAVKSSAPEIKSKGGALIEECIDIVKENPGKTALIVGTTAASAVATGGVAFAAAPKIGAFVSSIGFGVGGGTLSGAAASSAGLAALGGGSLAAGGAGMAGGTAVVTVVGAATGSMAGGGIAIAGATLIGRENQARRDGG
ncbi:hypothetical protein ACQR5W_08385 [Xanthomonas sacchari]|uniref:hypothetical protein n=1 Tax=Xanthomonas sp. SHU 308 TaxID=1591201 RepID=UPI0012FF2F85|nr:hypothetical protein [Xanthomonas sp. SHU 308]